MDFDPQPFLIGPAILKWLAVFGGAVLISLIVGLMLSFAAMGVAGPAAAWTVLKRGVVDLLSMSPRHIAAIASLTVKESRRRQDLMVGVVFVLLFMFAGWFLGETDVDTPAKPYISFVLTSIRWLVIPVALLLACWGLPQDIKVRSLHTVVTKPVRRSEIVLGRMAGYGFVITLAVVVMGAVGYVWLLRQVPEDAQAQLISRVPIYGELEFLDRTGQPGSGINTGDIWEFREYIEGNTKSQAIYTFGNLDPDRLRSDEGLRLEYRFELFRSHKGDIDRGILAQFDLVNEEQGLRIPYPPVPFEAREFAYMQARSSEEGGRDPIITIPARLTYTPEGQTVPQSVDLFDDLITDDGTLTVAVRCIDPQQYLGAARPDLFIRTPDRPFVSGYAKAVLGIWLMAILIVVLGTTASTFVKGPVATMLTFALILVGQTLRPFMDEQLTSYVEDRRVLGGGMLESAYRIVTQMNMQTELPEGAARDVIMFLDNRIYDLMTVLQHVIPDFTYFNMTPYVANGFDVPLNTSLLPAIATTLGYFIPCLILGYFALQLRELEAK